MCFLDKYELFTDKPICIVEQRSNLYFFQLLFVISIFNIFSNFSVLFYYLLAILKLFFIFIKFIILKLYPDKTKHTANKIYFFLTF